MLSGGTIAAIPRHRLSRWHAVPLAQWLATQLAGTRLRPWQVSCAGFLLVLLATLVFVLRPEDRFLGALAVWFAWLCDRLDGALARRQGTASAWGAWLDANLDELGDVLLHVGVAVAASVTASQAAWAALAAFLAGKYLFVAGLRFEEQLPKTAAEAALPASSPSTGRWWYHALGDADVRLHLLLAALVTGWLLPELILVASYYNVRWMARYFLVARRLLPGRVA